MKAEEVLNLLQTSRKTLHVYAHDGRIRSFTYLFRKYRTEIVVISEVGNAKIDSEEVYEEIASMLHLYSMKMYSKKGNHSIEVSYES